MTRLHAQNPAKAALPGATERWTRGALVTAALAMALLWSHWAQVVGLWKEWASDPNYSVGRLVPLVALYLVWDRRRMLRTCYWAPCGWGLALLLVAQTVRFLGLLLVFESAERYAFVVTIAGLVLLVAGRQVFWRLRWVFAFLLLMVPLPGRIHNALSSPMQEWATTGTVFVLEAIGVNAMSEGNVLMLDGQTTVGIAEACSGLRMLMAFVVVAAVLAFLVERPRWQRATLVLSSIPIAIICNVARLVATVILYANTSSTLAERFFHDFAGVTMMPVAITILVAELWLMKVLVIPDAVPAPPQTAHY